MTTRSHFTRRQFVGSLPTAVAAGALAGGGAASAQVTEPNPNIPVKIVGHKQVLLILSENFEELEFAAFTSVLSWTHAPYLKDKISPVDVVVAGFDKEVNGMGSMHVRPDVLVPDLRDEQLDRFDAVAVPACLGKWIGRKTDKGIKNLQSPATHGIVRRIHARGGIVATMCDGVIALPPELRGEKCSYWERGKVAAPGEILPAGIVVDNRVITTMGQAVAVPAAVLLLELLCGTDSAQRFVEKSPGLFGLRAEFVLKVPVLRVAQKRTDRAAGDPR